MMKYKPNPLDTSDVDIPDELKEIAGLLAKNTHEVWAAGRIKEGWRYGEIMDDKLKTHPGLVPYEELSESEKDYDRNTSLEALKFIIKLGFSIKKE
jgi:hypothetical protein